MDPGLQSAGMTGGRKAQFLTALGIAERERLRACYLAGLLQQEKKRHEKNFMQALSRRRWRRLIRWTERIEII